MRSVFGWSLPPGVTTLPGEEPCPPCQCCGGDPEGESCICPECPVCEVFGDPDCYREHGLTYTFSQLRGQAVMEWINQREAAAEEAYWQQFGEGDDFH